MNISFENRMHLAFDEPLEYKSIYIYPGKLKYYSFFSTADEYLDVSRLEEKDIRLMRLPYLDYMYEKSLEDNEFRYRWDMMIYILNIVFEDQSFDIIREKGKLYLKVYQRTNQYELLNKQCDKIKEDFLLENNKKEEITKDKLEELKDIVKNLEDKMYNKILISSEEFDEIRQLIMVQNDIKSEHYSSSIEAKLYEARKKLREMSKNKSETNIEDLIDVVSYCGHYTMKEMSNMTIRRFNRYLDLILNKDDYYMYKTLELSGNIELKQDLSYWVKHYEPKGKFDDVIISNSSLLPSIQDGKI